MFIIMRDLVIYLIAETQCLIGSTTSELARYDYVHHCMSQTFNCLEESSVRGKMILTTTVSYHVYFNDFDKI